MDKPVCFSGIKCFVQICPVGQWLSGRSIFHLLCYEGEFILMLRFHLLLVMWLCVNSIYCRLTCWQYVRKNLFMPLWFPVRALYKQSIGYQLRFICTTQLVTHTQIYKLHLLMHDLTQFTQCCADIVSSPFFHQVLARALQLRHPWRPEGASFKKRTKIWQTWHNTNASLSLAQRQVRLPVSIEPVCFHSLKTKLLSLFFPVLYVWGQWRSWVALWLDNVSVGGATLWRPTEFGNRLSPAWVIVQQHVLKWK